MPKTKKGICLNCRKKRTPISPVADDSQIPPATFAQIKEPPVPDKACDTSESASDSEIPPATSEQVKASESTPEEADDAIKSATTEVSDDGADIPAIRCPRICEYDQPLNSSYRGVPIILYIGRRKTYFVPENIARQIGSLQQHLVRDHHRMPEARFPEVDDDIAHTFIHYLYTGDYQTLKPVSTRDMPWHAIEYNRSVLAYHAGVHCGLPGLAQHGKKYMQVFDKEISIFDIISLGRKHFSRIFEDTWFFEYLTRKIKESFEAEESIFVQGQFFNGFGEASDFDRFLGMVMARVYAHKISSIRAAQELGRMENESPTAMTINGGSVANTHDTANLIPGRHKQWRSHIKAQSNRSQEASPASSIRAEAWLKLEGDNDENKSSSISILTPCSSASSAPAKSDSDLDPDVCPR